MAEEAKTETNEIKFSEEELKSLKDLQTNYQEKQAILRQLAVQRILLDQQSNTLDNRMKDVQTEYEAVQQSERDLVAKLNEKYGPGQLDPATGIFTPTE